MKTAHEAIAAMRAKIEQLDEKYRTLRVNGTIQQAKEADLVVHVLLGLSNFLDTLEAEQPVKGLEEYCPYKTTVESILKMFDSYSITTDKSDFIDNIRVKCKDAVEYDKLFPKHHREMEQPAEGLNEEIARYLREECSSDDEPSVSDIASHFYELGCRHTAVMYDDIEHERQRAEEAEISEDLKEEYKDYVENDPVYSKLVNRNAGLGIARHFAEWGAEHLKK